MSNVPTVRMWHENLAVMSPSNDPLPLAKLSPDSHVHGGLRLEIAGRLVPYMGYWGPDDVCFNQWLEELQGAAAALGRDGGRHVFDEGEQGQPAFVFERADERGYFTIGPSDLSGVGGDPDWEKVAFLPADFISALAQFRNDFIAAIMREASVHGAQWLAEVGIESPG
jgi:hypothetical protein